MAYDLLNRNKHYSAILEELSDEAKNFYDELGEDTCQGLAEEESDRLADSHVETMREYSHQSNTSQWGNFANIRQDWNNNFVRSEVEPWGDYDDMLKSMDEETISDEDKAKVQQWAEDWFWTAYGTRWTRYNFADTLGQFAYEAEQDRNQE
jgi:hypothetical protein